MLLYAKAMRQALIEHVIDFLMCVPKESMLADALTKTMDPGELWEVFYAMAWWTPLRKIWSPEDLKVYNANIGSLQRWRMLE